MNPDVRIEREGNIFMVEFCSDQAKAWQEENLETEPYQWLGKRLAVDQHYAAGIVEQMQQYGLTVT